MLTRSRIILPIVLMSFFVLIVGCSDDSGGVRPVVESIPSEINFPLIVGNSWVYAAGVDTTTTSLKAAETARIVGTEMNSGELYYVLENVTLHGTTRALIRQAGQDVLTVPKLEESKRDDPFQEWMDQITADSMPWKIADLDVQPGTQWVELNASSRFNLGGTDVIVTYIAEGMSQGRESVSVPMGEYGDVYHGSFTTRLTLSEPSGFTISSMMTYQEYWVADGVGIIKSVSAGSAEMDGEGYTITTSSELTDYDLQ